MSSHCLRMRELEDPGQRLSSLAPNKGAVSEMTKWTKTARGHARKLMVLLIVLAASCATSPADGGPSPRSVTVAEGVQLHVLEAGVETRAVSLVLIPGWSTGAEIWSRQISHFARQRRVISFDPRSQSRSTITTSGNTPETRAEDLHALLAVERLRSPPVIVAWSQGVQDLAAYVQRYGTADIAGIVFVDAAVSRGLITPPDVAAQRKRRPKRERLPPAEEPQLLKWIPRRLAPSPEKRRWPASHLRPRTLT